MLTKLLFQVFGNAKRYWLSIPHKVVFGNGYEGGLFKKKMSSRKMRWVDFWKQIS